MAESFPPVIFVDIKQAPLSRLPGRQQRWMWVAKNANNQKKLARSTERYTNKQDCLDSITQVFGDGSSVYLRQVEAGNVVLRMAVPL